MIAIASVRVVEEPANYDGLKTGRSYFFNTDRFLKLRQNESIIRFNLHGHDQLLASIVFVLVGEKAVSGHMATFGSFDLSPEVGAEDLIGLLGEIETHLLTRGISEIEIRNWPEAYPHFIKAQAALSNSGYQEADQEVDQYIEVTEQAFSVSAAYNEQKKLNKCIRAGFQFRQLDIKYLERAYELVVMSRNRKGYPVTMSLNELKKAYSEAPENYLLFGVFDEEKLVATAISIRLNDGILYNFYHGDHDDYRHFSPTVLLLDGIYLFCQAQGIDILDLGISSVGGKINTGLYRFKENVGCTSCRKITFHKHLAK